MRSSSALSQELLLPSNEVMEGRTIFLVNKSLLHRQKRKKSHNASARNFQPQPQIDLESLFKIIKMKKNTEEKSYKAT